MKRIARRHSRTRVALVAGVIGGTACVPAAIAQTRQGAAEPALAAAEDGDNWFSHQLRKFRSHPHLDRAYRLSATGQLDAAAVEFERGLAIDPANAVARLDYVQVLARLQRHSAVILQVDALLKGGSDSASARAWRANAYQALGRFEQAAAEYEKLVATPTATSEQRRFALGAMADLAIARKRYAEALRALDRIDAKSRDADYFARRATAQESLGRTAEADADYRRAIDAARNPGQRVSSLASLARLQERRADREGARKSLSDAVALDPANADLKLSLGRLAYRAGNYAEALRWARKTTELRRGSADREFLADALLAAGDLAGAAREYTGLLAELKDAGERRRVRSALSNAYGAPARVAADGVAQVSSPQPGETNREAAPEAEADPARVSLNAAYRARNYPEAIRWASWIVQQRPEPKDREFLANLFYAQKDYASAVREYQALLPALAANTDRCRTYMAIGFSYSGQRMFAKAAEAFEKAVVLKPEPTAIGALTRALDAAGEPGTSIPVLVRVLQAKPLPELRLKLASLYAQAGDDDAAVGSLRQVIDQRAPASLKSEAWRQLSRLQYARAEAAEARDAATALMTLAPDDAEAHLMLARLELDAKSPRAALPHLLRSVELAPNAEAYRLLAHAHGVLGDWAAAAGARQAELRLGGLTSAERREAHKALGHAQGEANDWQAATTTYEALVALPEQTHEERIDSLERLANAYSTQGRHAEAATVIEHAIDSGENDPVLRRSAGFARFSNNEWSQALVHFRAAHETSPAADTAVYIARCYEKLRMPGLAIHYLSDALTEPRRADPTLRLEIYEQLGYLYADGFEYANAASMFEHAVEIRPDPAAEFRVARMKWLADQKAEATATLEAISPGSLSPALQAERLDMLVDFAREQGQSDKALVALEQANEIAPSAERSHRLGVLHLAERRFGPAIEFLQAAVRREPRQEYKDSLRAALFDAGRFDEAAALLDPSPERAEERIVFFQNVAYHYKRQARNSESVAWFKRGVDEALASGAKRDRLRSSAVADARQQTAAPRQPESPGVTNAPARLVKVKSEVQAAPAQPIVEDEQRAQADAAPPADLDQRLAGMRSEIRSLQDDFDLTLYESYRAKSRGSTTSTFAASPSGGVVPSQGGLEAAWRPPIIGFRNERTFQLFGRLLWSNRPNSLRIDDESTQAGLGARYKPLQDHQFYISGERLFKIGSNATDDWLVRASYGWTSGFEAQAGKSHWNYTTFYADAGYFTRSNTRALFAEVRQGHSFSVSDNVVVTPHLVVDGRSQSPDPDRASYAEAGAGVSAKIFFNQSRYEGYRSSAELLLQYKHGFSSRVPSGWLVTAVVRY